MQTPIDVILNAIIVLQTIHLSIQFNLGIPATSHSYKRSEKCLVVSQLFSQLESDDTPQTPLEQLRNDLALIEAIEERNRAQIYSFIDEQDQWESMDEDDRQLLLSKETILHQIKQYELDM